jgi:hypothetical protein
MKLAPKNWESFQHYKDRSPAWIKLHKGLLDDFEFARLPVESRALAPMLWLLASESENGVFEGDVEKLAFRLRLLVKEVAEAIHPLIQAGFFVEYGVDAPVREKWPSRHVPAALKTEIFERDQYRCRYCNAAENLEIDHMTPVSKGGESVRENLQTLCRSCNRSKRSKSAEQVATQPIPPRSLEKEEEREKEKKEAIGPRPYSVEFENDFWKPYPRTPVMSKQEAWREWLRLPVDDRGKATAAVAPYVAFLKSKPDHPAVHACRFLKQKRFEGFETQVEQIKVGFPIRPGTDQFKAWMAHFPRKSIQYSLMVRSDDTGQPYYAPAEWPPSPARAANG